MCITVRILLLGIVSARRIVPLLISILCIIRYLRLIIPLRILLIRLTIIHVCRCRVRIIFLLAITISIIILMITSILLIRLLITLLVIIFRVVIRRFRLAVPVILLLLISMFFSYCVAYSCSVSYSSYPSALLL